MKIVPPRNEELVAFFAVRKTVFAIQGHFAVHCFVTAVL